MAPAVRKSMSTFIWCGLPPFSHGYNSVPDDVFVSKICAESNPIEDDGVSPVGAEESAAGCACEGPVYVPFPFPDLSVGGDISIHRIIYRTMPNP
jgi:hypothetical protein